LGRSRSGGGGGGGRRKEEEEEEEERWREGGGHGIRCVNGVSAHHTHTVVVVVVVVYQECFLLTDSFDPHIIDDAQAP